MSRLDEIDIKFLTGVGPKRAELLAEQLHIRTFYDLLYYFPFRYVDRSRIFQIRELESGMPFIQLKGRFVTMTTVGEGAKRRMQALFSDGTGTIDVVWFNRIKFVAENYRTGVEYVIFGRPSIFNGRFNLAHPEIETSVPGNEPHGLRGAYNMTDKLRNRGFTSKTFQTLISNLLAKTAFIPETLPQTVTERYHLTPLRDALENIHFPKSVDLLNKAKLRLKFEELFLIQLNILRIANGRKAQQKGFVFSRIGEFFNRFYSDVLPFPLTGAQKRVMHEIRADLGSGRQMNRLLQGDVGSGKTIVALMSALIAVDNGFQTCLMAPTEILATQHYESLSAMAGKIGVRVELLTGSTKKKKRDEIHAGLTDGSTHILIGTHAVIEDNVEFRCLGLVIIDEQHRFGVEQRSRLWAKSKNPPHILVMTATPIPRTLAMTIYGDLDVSVIDELPPGRKPIQTIHKYDKQLTSLYNGIRKQINLGRQVYIVFPLISESEKMDLKNLEEGYASLCQIFPEFNISKVHGKMKSAEKDAEMQKFVSGETQILVATTVIEVGVNVPNASVMVILDAQRFGLSQLHQLRGRVGRGAEQSYCILVTGYELSAVTRKRIDIMCDTNDGFRIAEADLKLRGPGDLEGTQQSGIAFDLKIADIARDGQFVALARQEAQKIIDADPTCTSKEYAMLWRRLRELRDTNINWAAIS